jgi:hypothetical protein
MQSLFRNTSVKILTTAVLVCFITFQLTCCLPPKARAGTAGDDLKTIEYKYYFRGNYEKAIAELRILLERTELSRSQVIEAREYLAASLILSGAVDSGKDQYLRLLEMDGSYGGPDPSVFKPAIIAAYDEARAEYVSMMIRSVSEREPVVTAAPVTETAQETGKPLYKKWWFYATMAAVLIVVAGAASSGGGEEPPPARDTGTVTVEVDVP